MNIRNANARQEAAQIKNQKNKRVYNTLENGNADMICLCQAYRNDMAAIRQKTLRTLPAGFFWANCRCCLRLATCKHSRQLRLP